jgi:hypothetical protein
MSSFLDRAREQAQQALNQGKQKVDEVQTQREGTALLRKLGAAYAKEQNGTGSAEATQQALEAVQRHAEQFGQDFLNKS